MWGNWLNNSTLPALEQTAQFAERRHQLLAGNIANLDVPGYKTRDLDQPQFQQVLQQALKTPANRSSGYGVSAGIQPEPMEQVRDVSRQVLYLDNSDVSLEEQVATLTKNNALHDMSIALMRSQLATLEAAIRESVNV
jgi:flagellar basal-body rod protein FlgB